VATSFNIGGTLFEVTAPSLPTQARQRLLVGGAASVRGSWLDDRIQVDLATRVDGLNDRGRSSPSFFQRDVVQTIDTTRAWLQPTAGVRGVPVRGLQLAAHLGRRERVPNFYELFGSDGQVRGNPALLPEKQWSWDAGLHYELARYLSADAVYAEARLEQVITFVYTGIDLPRAENIGKALVRSVEMSARSQPISFMILAASYTLQLTENQSEGFVFGKPLPGKPPHQARGELTFLVPKPIDARAMFEFQYISATSLDTSGIRFAPPRYLLNASLTVRVLSGPVRASVELRNLLDQRTATVVASSAGDRVTLPIVDFLGFPLPGRSVFFTLSYAFDDEGKEKAS
jgi:outer membrane receptor protein involved in Fe transport